MSEKSQNMLDAAVSYFLSAERCFPDFKFGNYGDHSVNAPVITSYAFSIELLLKLLLKINGITKRGHNLLNLYNELPADNKQNLQYVESNLDADDQISSSFEDWRYAYEKNDLFCSPDELRRIFICLHRELRRVKPELKSIYENNWGQFDPDWNWAWPELQLA